jgi:hypothetical protein
MTCYRVCACEAYVRLETNKLSRVEILRLPPTRGEINVQEIKVGIDSECAKRTADVSYVKSEATPLQYRSSGIGFFLCVTNCRPRRNSIWLQETCLVCAEPLADQDERHATSNKAQHLVLYCTAGKSRDNARDEGKREASL